MKKLIIPLLILLIPLVLAAPNLEIEKNDLGSTVIRELNNPAKFEFTINNLGASDNFEIYSFLGVSMSPKGTFELPSGKSTTEVEARPNEEIRKLSGFYNFEYELRGQNTGIYKDTLRIRIVSLRESLSITVSNILPGDEKANITIKNLENTHIDNLKLNFKSVFFDSEQTISLKPEESITIEIPISQEKIKKIVAGQYIITIKPEIEGKIESLESAVKYLEKEGFSVVTDSSGLIVRKTTITKANEGNTIATTKIEKTQDILSRLFTSHSTAPNVERKGLLVKYTWEKELSPGESFTITTTTNYTFPFIVLIIIIIIAILVKQQTRTNLILDKRVSFVRTKGGEFALKIRLHAKARKALSNIKITDHIPIMTKLYDKFGIKPDKIDEDSRTLHWNIPSLSAGEERVFSYIIYSKLNVVGQFELPLAHASYSHNDKLENSTSNKTFFVAETTE